jgi:hypothetical protein
MSNLLLPLSYLPRGPLYWSVQAIDASFIGGPFAPEQRYQLSPPVISGLSNLVLAPNPQGGPFLFSVRDDQTAVALLQFNAISFNENLIASSNVLISVSCTNAALLITPKAHQSGTAEIVRGMGRHAILREPPPFRARFLGSNPVFPSLMSLSLRRVSQ